MYLNNYAKKYAIKNVREGEGREGKVIDCVSKVQSVLCEDAMRLKRLISV